MPEPKFTPAPWVYAPDYDENDGDIILNSGYEKPVSIVFKSDLQDEEQYPRDEVVANAHLIAAAPDLYEALECFMDARKSLLLGLYEAKDLESKWASKYPDAWDSCRLEAISISGRIQAIAEHIAIAALAKARGEVGNA